MWTVFKVLGHSEPLVAGKHGSCGNRKCVELTHRRNGHGRLLHNLRGPRRDRQNRGISPAYGSSACDGWSCGLPRRMGQSRSTRVLRQLQPHIPTRDLRIIVVGVSISQRSPPLTPLFLFEFLRISGESRFVSDLSVRRRRALEHRVAFRLANPTPTTSRPSTTTAIVVQEFVQSATVNVPFSPIINDVNDTNSVVARDLPKCLMKSDGNVFD